MKEHLFSLTKKDFEITYFSGSGAGGQHRNKHMNCVRIKHKETGIIATGQEERSLEQNKKNAFERLVKNEKFQLWLKIKASEYSVKEGRKQDKPVHEILQDAMSPVHLKIEVKDEEGEWVDEKSQKDVDIF